MTTRDDIIDTITRLFWHTDHHDWAEVQGVFADQVLLDYTSLQGGEPSTLAPSEIVSGWRTHFATIPAHQHLVANHLVQIDGTTATVTAQFVATHHWDDRRWTLGGDYHFTLVEPDGRWFISAMTMTAVWQEPGPLLAGIAPGTER